MSSSCPYYDKKKDYISKENRLYLIDKNIIENNKRSNERQKMVEINKSDEIKKVCLLFCFNFAAKGASLYYVMLIFAI